MIIEQQYMYLAITLGVCTAALLLGELFLFGRRWWERRKLKSPHVMLCLFYSPKQTWTWIYGKLRKEYGNTFVDVIFADKTYTFQYLEQDIQKFPQSFDKYGLLPYFICSYDELRAHYPLAANKEIMKPEELNEFLSAKLIQELIDAGKQSFKLTPAMIIIGIVVIGALYYMMKMNGGS